MVDFASRSRGGDAPGERGGRKNGAEKSRAIKVTVHQSNQMLRRARSPYIRNKRNLPVLEKIPE